MVRKPAKTIFEVEAEQPSKEDKRTQPKEFVIRRGAFGLYTVGLSSGGVVPSMLAGSYTTTLKAEEAVQSYLLSKHA